MDIQNIDPELRRVARSVPRVHLERRVTLGVLSFLSAIAPGKRVHGVERRVLREEGLRIYFPRVRSGSALLWIHGGGLILGSAAQEDRRCALAAQETGAVVVSVDYRLAPKTRFPGALDDCHAALGQVVAHAEDLGIDPERIAVGGQSAGGGLAACLVQRLQAEGRSVRAQWLFCPMLDDRTAEDLALDTVNHFVWNNRMNRAGWRAYLGSMSGAEQLPPYAAAARAEDLSGLPPAWLYASDTELFFAETQRYAERLKAAGVDTTVEVVHGAPHGFEGPARGSRAARELMNSAHGWLAERL